MKGRDSILCMVLALTLGSPWVAPSSAQARRELDRASAERWREDLRYLARELPMRHKDLFATLPRRRFDLAVERLDGSIPSLTPQQILVELARLVAGFGDGHTRLVTTGASSVVLRQYPLQLFHYREGVFVQAAPPEHSRAVGARLVKIGNVPIERALQAVRDIVSHDNAMTIRHRLPSLLAVPEILFGLGLIERMETAQFTFEQRGEQFVLDLKPTLPGARSQWVDARDDAAAPTPLWLKDPQNAYWFEYLADSRTVYVQYNATVDKREESIAEFCKRVFAFVDTHPVDRFVLDLRRNGGGDNTLNLPLLHGLIRRDKLNRPGTLFVIIGRGTFSAGVWLAADLEKHTSAIFVGEPTGGRPNHFGNAASFVLPNSRLAVQFSTEWIQRSVPGDAHPWKVPHLAVELTPEDYFANQDPALKAILDYAPKPPLADTLTELVLKQGYEAAVGFFREFKADPLNAYYDYRFALRLVSRRLNARERFAESIKLCELNIAEHPRDDEAHTLLADAYLKSGQRELAVRSYERALALNPKNWRVADQLRALRAGRMQPR